MRRCCRVRPAWRCQLAQGVGRDLARVVDEVQTIVTANAQLAEYHRSKRQTVAHALARTTLGGRHQYREPCAGTWRGLQPAAGLQSRFFNNFQIGFLESAFTPRPLLYCVVR